MNSHHSPKEEELRRREEALKERELQIRLRELEAELEPTPVTPTRKHQEESRPQPKPPWYQRLPNWLKFIVVVLGVLVAIRIAAWLASVVLVLAVSWVAYKLFLESQD